MRKLINAVVVTYNRKKLLIECLTAIMNQTYPVNKIILIDNASTDGTKNELESKGFINNENVEYHLMDTNLGGAGGFHEGIKIARDEKCDWVWIMDDDTIPEETCLEKLVDAMRLIDKHEKISFLSSAVYGMKNEFMNVPMVSTRLSSNEYPGWYKYLSNGLIEVERATFVSILINKQAIEYCGLPCKDYFIWGDDSEYTLRLSHYYGPAYFVGKSRAIHKRTDAKELVSNK